MTFGELRVGMLVDLEGRRRFDDGINLTGETLHVSAEHNPDGPPSITVRSEWDE